MIEIYTKKGMTLEDARTVVMTMSKYPDIFVDTMMVEELGLMPPEGTNTWWEPMKVCEERCMLFA
jgi:vacuolar iron transporter family protein